MLPFLKLKQEKQLDGGSVAETKQMNTDGSDDEFDSMEAAAQDLIDAIGRKDVKAVAEALRAAFELADSEPHIEGEHIEGNE